MEVARRLVKRLLPQHRCEAIKLNPRDRDTTRETGTDIESLKKTLMEHND